MKRFPVGRAMLLAGVSAFAITVVIRSAAAQSVNYGALEELYGEPITTSVTGQPQKASDAPANLTIVTQDDIRRSGANNIPDILQFVAGIDVRRYGSVDADVAVQGYNQPANPRLLVLVNGRQVYFDYFGLVSWQNIPVQLEEIRQIEVVKGPSSALYGFNAASGVINIITYDPLFDKVNTATARFGTQALYQGSAVITVHLGDAVGVRMSAGGLEQNEYKPAVATTVNNPTLGQFNFDSKAQVAPGVQVTLEGSVTNSNNENNTPTAAPEFETYHTNSIKAGVMADTAWGTVAIDAYRNWLGFNSSGGLVVANTVYVVQASDTLKLNADNTIRVSLEYRNNAATSAIVGGTIGYSVYSASGMWNWQITPALSFTNSLRIDLPDAPLLWRAGSRERLHTLRLQQRDSRAAQLQLRPGLQTDRPGHDSSDRCPWLAGAEPVRLRLPDQSCTAGALGHRGQSHVAANGSMEP